MPKTHCLNFTYNKNEGKYQQQQQNISELLNFKIFILCCSVRVCVEKDVYHQKHFLSENFRSQHAVFDEVFAYIENTLHNWMSVHRQV